MDGPVIISSLQRLLSSEKKCHFGSGMMIAQLLSPAVKVAMLFYVLS